MYCMYMHTDAVRTDLSDRYAVLGRYPTATEPYLYYLNEPLLAPCIWSHESSPNINVQKVYIFFIDNFLAYLVD